jgi:phytoene dehydrogenase-like protein
VSYDVIVIGGGVNGLAAAAYLARAGRRVVVLEARPAPGGLAVTAEATPGFRVDWCGHDAGWVPDAVARELDLARHGLALTVPDATVFAPQPDGRALTLWTDAARTAQEIAAFAPADAAAWPAFTRQVARFAGFLGALYGAPPPRVPDATGADLLPLLGAARRLRALGKRDMIELLRVLPMPVADWLDDTFASDALKGAVGAAGITRIFQGPRSGGTAFVLLHHHVGRPPGAMRAAHLVRGGVGALGAALAAAARAAGAEVRTAAAVREIRVTGGRATGVVLDSGERVDARLVVSSADPRRTFGLVDPVWLGPEFTRAVRNIRFRGAVATVHLALGDLPRFTACPDAGSRLHGAISIAPSLEYLERAYDDAKHGGVSRRPYIEARIPTLLDPSLAPPGRHILTAQVQYAPYHRRDGAWDAAERERLADLVVATLTEYAPNVPGAVLHRHVVTPRDLEERWGLTEGSPYQGELTLDQVLFMRPVAGWARYATPVPGLYLCGAGTHPGGGLAGAPGRNAARVILKEAS